MDEIEKSNQIYRLFTKMKKKKQIYMFKEHIIFQEKLTHSFQHQTIF